MVTSQLKGAARTVDFECFGAECQVVGGSGEDNSVVRRDKSDKTVVLGVFATAAVLIQSHLILMIRLCASIGEFYETTAASDGIIAARILCECG